MKKIISITMAVVLMLCAFTSCGVKTPAKQKTFDVTEKETVNVLILLQDGREMELELYPKIAPITVQNFVDLATSGFYDGLIFHRIVEGFVVQGGDPKGDGTGGSGAAIKGEFSENGVENTLSHTTGVISMARQSSLTSSSPASEKDTLMDSATSQFFIVLDNSAKSSLDGKYAGFGKMIRGFDVLQDLGNVTVDQNDKPLKDIVINSIRVVEK
ncbi:MAG: peptidylprolyl isomerase [Clostridia bacterium]|nr:peptidylprolyl isomerase [Clostridia bacterium]